MIIGAAGSERERLGRCMAGLQYIPGSEACSQGANGEPEWSYKFAMPAGSKADFSDSEHVLVSMEGGASPLMPSLQSNTSAISFDQLLLHGCSVIS